jgi:hypothetical protein
MNDASFPDGWSEDPLSAFIEQANRNTLGVFVHYKEWFTLLQGIDGLFENLWKGFVDPPSFYQPLLFMRAHSCFRAAVRLSTSGQLPEAYSLARGAIECAIYGFHFDNSLDGIQTWVARDESEAGRKQARKDLAFGPILTKLEARHADIGRIARLLYEFTIDAGAHPNRKSVTLAMEVVETNETVSANLDMLNISNLPLVACLKTNAQVGISVLQVFGLVFPDRYNELGMPRRIAELSNGL